MRTDTGSAPRAGRLILPVLAALILLLGLQLPGPLTPSAGAADDSAEITLHTMSPKVADPGTPLVLLGRVRNTGDSAITDPVVRMFLGDDRLNTRNQVSAWMNSTGRGASTEVGRAILNGPLRPGRTASFQLVVRADRIPDLEARTNRPAAVSVTDGTASGSTTHARLPTVLPWNGGDSKVTAPLDLQWVVPLTLPADPDLFSATGTERLAAWRKAIGPGSPVDQLLRQLRGMPVTWLVDPSMLEPSMSPDDKLPEADARAEGSPDSTPTASETPSPTTTESGPTPSGSGTSDDETPSASATTPESSGTDSTDRDSTASGSPETSSPSPSTTTEPEEDEPDDRSVNTLVTDLRQRLVNREDSQPVWWLPYGDPDLQGLRAAGGSDAVRRSLGRSLSTASSSMSEVTVHWPATAPTAAGVRAVTTDWRATRDGDVPPTLLSTNQVSDTRSGRVSHRLADGTPVLAYDEGLSSLTGSDQKGGDGQRVQHFLGDALATYLQAPANARDVMVLAPRTDQADAESVAALIRGTDDVPWLRSAEASVALESAERAPRTAQVRRPQSDDDTPASPITKATLTHAAADRRLLGDLGSILVDSEDVVTGWTAAYDELGSARWRGHQRAHSTALRRISTALHTIPKHVAVRPGSINFFTDGGEVGVTVVNELNRPVHNVRLVLEPRLAILSVREQPEPLTVRADTRATVRVPLRALSSGQVEVDARLSTPAGLPLGAPGDAPTQLEFTVRPTGSWLYWVLGAVAGPILVVGVYRSLRGPRRQSEAAPAPDDAEPESDDD